MKLYAKIIYSNFPNIPSIIRFHARRDEIPQKLQDIKLHIGYSAMDTFDELMLFRPDETKKMRILMEVYKDKDCTNLIYTEECSEEETVQMAKEQYAACLRSIHLQKYKKG